MYNVDVLNINRHSPEESLLTLRYIFPKQFGLSGLFTPSAGSYTHHKAEIKKTRLPNGELPLAPKRLCGTVSGLVTRILSLHSKCSYFALLNYYCPVPDGPMPYMKPASLEYASSVGEVSAFVHGAVGRVIPTKFLGGDHNQKVLKGHIDRFIRLRKFERLSLHDVMQCLKVFSTCSYNK